LGIDTSCYFSKLITSATQYFGKHHQQTIISKPARHLSTSASGASGKFSISKTTNYSSKHRQYQFYCNKSITLAAQCFGISSFSIRLGRSASGTEDRQQ
jgi:hypothetical protein